MQLNRLFWRRRRNRDRRERQNAGLFKNDTSIKWSMKIIANGLSLSKHKQANKQMSMIKRKGLGLGAHSVRMTATVRQLYTREIKGLTSNLQ